MQEQRKRDVTLLRAKHLHQSIKAKNNTKEKQEEQHWEEPREDAEEDEVEDPFVLFALPLPLHRDSLLHVDHPPFLHLRRLYIHLLQAEWCKRILFGQTCS